MKDSLHKPVMEEEVLRFIQPKAGMIVVDATVGLGGHALSIAQGLAPSGRLIAIDKDEESLLAAKERLEGAGVRCDFVREDFRHLDRVLDRCGIEAADAFVFDLGISSYQLDNPVRGFSIRAEGPLDMRMDRSSFISAYDLLNNLTEEEIASILWKFGQERFSRRIANGIVRARQGTSISSTKELADIVVKALPYKFRFQRIHPATRTFQALRIAVNRELDSLDEALKKAALYLNKGGRICVISFHSLEDKIVKENFRELSRTERFRPVFKKIMRPTPEEICRNPRSRSAKMRVIERVK
ncbi:MAG: 16S rRNA (cytosine(1402)-N(4))-methyltransferase RsmH [Candidatus Omnitrophica bacterium]|nr:16S rRNA (cytosine(1402)-N(4))-methyltransferase RsmH [Candidatus Omnitrophota bacterium]MDD5575045.1 16S rRNA (cytosine(1402)-N(4))-methyltransferase RsmH [Candidatus Omnitrophota bacterium]